VARRVGGDRRRRRSAPLEAPSASVDHRRVGSDPPTGSGDEREDLRRAEQPRGRSTQRHHALTPGSIVLLTVLLAGTFACSRDGGDVAGTSGTRETSATSGGSPTDAALAAEGQLCALIPQLDAIASASESGVAVRRIARDIGTAVETLGGVEAAVAGANVERRVTRLIEALQQAAAGASSSGVARRHGEDIARATSRVFATMTC
jgi:hypothetical protein